MRREPEPPTAKERQTAEAGGERRSARSRPRADLLAAVAAGGALGGVARYEVGLAANIAPGTVPWATLGVNLSGSLLLGVILALVIERWPPTRYVRPFAATGFCGGYTTFSAVMVESALLFRDGRTGVALAYLAVSVAGGLVAVYIGILLGRLWPARGRRHP